MIQFKLLTMSTALEVVEAATYSTPLGWRAVLLTLWETIVATVRSDVEWKLLLCCFAIWSVRKTLEESGSGRGGV